MTAPTARPARAIRAAAALEERLDGDPHQPNRPGWTCQACNGGAPWPCSPARVRLGEAYAGDLVALSAYMGALLAAALTEMPTTPPAELFDRFINWTR